MKKSWKLGSSLLNTLGRRGPRPARKVAAIAGEAVGLDMFGRLIGGLAPALALAMLTTRAVAGPEGAQVVNGNVSIQKQGDKTVIHASNNAIINYKNFDIGKNETVQFVQPDALARVLNRINSPSPTQIDGKLLANGRVFIVNPAGVIFGQGAVVNAAGIYAAAGNIADADFVKGIYKFTGVQGSVTNKGVIQAGNVALVGKSVANTGTIIADKGAVVMASGDTVMVGEQGGRMYVRVESQPQAGDSGSTATKDMSGGGWAVGDVYSLAIRNTGTIKAKNVHAQAAKGVVNIGGTVDASSQAAGEKGGTVKLLGDYVGVSGTVDASGPAGGGEILVGGNFQGKGVEQNAVRTNVTSTATLKADATASGDGGRIIVWADDQTSFTGALSARGAGSGKGGFAEVSGKQNLRFSGDADLRGPGGVGELLLDPATITITGGAGDGDVDGTDTFFGDPSAGEGIITFADVGPTTVFESEIEGLVANAAVSITLQATQSITTAGAFTGGLSLGATNFTLQVSNDTAAGVIDLSGVSIDSTSGNIQILGSTSGIEASTITLGSITTGAGNLTVSNGLGSITAQQLLTVGGGNLSLTTLNGALTVNAGLSSTGAGSITLNSTGANTSVAGGINNTGGTVTFGNTGAAGMNLSGDISADGDVTFNRSVTMSGNVNISSGGTIFTNAGVDTGAGNVTLAAGQVEFDGGAGSVDGSGTLSIRPTSGATSISVGDAATGTFDLDVDDTDALGASFSLITIGSATGTGLMTIGTSTFNSPVTFIEGGAGGQVSLTNLAALSTTNDAVTLAAGTGGSGLFTKPAGGVINTGSGNITLQGDAMDIAGVGEILTTGGVIFQPASVNRPIVVGGAGTAADLVLSEAEVNDAVSGESFVVIGQSAGQHAITLSALNFGSATTIRTPSGGSITVDGAVSAPSIRLNGVKTFAAGASVTTTAGNITLDGGAGTVTAPALSLDAGTANITTGAIDIGTNAVTITGDEITIDGAITGSGASSLVLQPSAASTSIDVGVNAGGTGTLDLSDPELANITGIGGLTIGRSNGTHTIVIRDVPIPVPTTIRTPSGGSIAVNGAISAPGVTLTGVKTLNTSGAISATSGGAIVLDGGTTTLTTNFFLTADEIDLGSSVTGAFNLTLQPSADGVSIGVGGGAGTLDISDADLSNISGLTGITIGRSGGTHAIEVGSTSVVDPLTIRGGAITTSGAITGSDNASVTLTGSSIQLGGNITTAGDAIAIQGPATLGSGVVVDTTDGGGSAAGANVTFTSTINGLAANAQTLDVRGGTGGTVNLQGAVGGVNALQDLSLSGGTVSFSAINSGGLDVLSRTAINSSALLTIGGLAEFETRLSAGAGITLSNTANTFGSVRARTRSDDGTGGSVAGDVTIVEAGDSNVVEGEAGGAFSFTSTGDITVTGPVSAGTDVSFEGVDFTSNSGGFIQATEGSVLIDHTGAVTIGDTIDAFLNALTQNITINGSSVAINAALSADDTVGVNAGTGALTIGAAVNSSAGAVSMTGGAVTLSSGGSITAATTAALTGSGNVNIAGDVTAATSITLHAGSDGTGNLAFTALGVDLGSASITLRAGDGLAGGGTAAAVDALTNAPLFIGALGGATSPATYVHRQDGNITNAQIADAGQFQGVSNVGGVGYTLQSDDGAVQLTNGGKVAGSTLLITGLNPFVISANIDFGGGQVTISDADVQANGVEVTVGTGLLAFTGDLSLNGNNLTLTANEVNFNGGAGSVTGTGGLILQPAAAGFDIAVGAPNQAGRFDITDADLAAMAPTLTLVTVGRSGGTHAITVDSATLTNPFLLRGGVTTVIDNSGGAGLIGTGRGSVTMTGSGIVLNDDVLTQGGTINFDAPVTLAPTTGNTITVATTSGSDGGDISFGSTTDSDGTARTLSVDAGEGSATFLGAVGGTNALASIAVEGESIGLGAVRTTGSQAYTGATTLGGDLASTTAGSILITGTTAVGSSSVISTAGAAGTDDITLTGAVTGGGNALTLDAGSSGDVALGANATGLSSFTAEGGTITTRSVTTSGAQSFTGVTTVTGNLVTSTAGGVTFTGNTTVNGNVSTTAGNILFNNNATLSGNLSTATSGTITASGTTTLTGATQSFQTANGAVQLAAVTGPSALTINSGTASTTLGTVGATRLTSLAVTGSTINASSTVSTTGNQTFTGATTLGGNLSTTGGDVLIVGAATLAAPVQVATAGGDITLGAVTGGGNAFTLSAGAGAVDVGGNIAGVSNLSATGATIAVNDVTTTGSQLYTGATTLRGDLASTTAGTIGVVGATTLGDTVSITTAGGANDDVSLGGTLAGGTNGLVINAGGGDAAITSAASGLSTLAVTGNTIAVAGVASTGNQTYTGSTTASGNLAATGAGSIQVNGGASLAGDVTTAGGNIAVTGTTTLTGSSQNFTSATGDITLAAVNGPANLSISAADGTVSLGAVGATAVQSLAVTADQINLNSTVNTTGGQTYDGPTTVTDDITTAGGNIRFFQNATISAGDNAVTMASGGGAITFETDLSGVGQSVTLNAGSGNIDLSGLTQDASGSEVATLGSITATGAEISLGRITTSGPQNYTAAGSITTNSRLRSTSNLLSLDADNEVRLGGDLVTSGGAIDLAGTTVIAGTTVLVSSSGGAITFADDVVGSADGVGSLGVDGGATGAVIFQGDIGTAADARLAALTTDGQSVSIRSANTSGAQAHNGPTLLNGTATSGASVTFADALTLAGDSSVIAASAAFQEVDAQTAGAQGLTVNTGSGAVSFGQPVGSTAALEFLNVTGTTTTSAVNTTGDQTYAGSTTINGNASAGGALTATGAFATTGNLTIASAMTVTGGTENVSLTGSTTAGSIAITGANISVANAASTSGGQSYQATTLTTIGGDLTAAGGAVTIAGPAELANGDRSISTAGGLITLGQLDGNGFGLGLDAGAGNIVLTAPITELATFLAVGNQITVPSLSTTGAQSYEGSPVFGGDIVSTGGGNISISNAASFSAPSTISTDGGTITLGGVIGGGNTVSLNAGAGTINLNGTAVGLNAFTASAGAFNIFGNITADQNITVNGATRLTGTGQTFRSENGGLTFGTIDSADSTRRSLTLSSGVVANAGSTVANIRLGGSVGATNPLGTFRLGAGAADAAVPPVSTVAVAPEFSAEGAVVKSGVDFANPGTFTINADAFELSKGEKLTAFGNLTINATEALLRDINSIGSLVVNAPTIRLAGRQRSSLQSGGASIPELDIGLDFVAAQGVTFNGSASIENLDGGTDVTFGSNSLASVPPISGGSAISLIFDGGISAAAFQRAGGNSDLLLALDLRADGRTTTNVATAIAGATPKEADIGPAQGVGISASLKDQLKEVGIYVKELSLDQQVDFLTGRAIYNDVPSNTASPSGSDYQITPNRLAVDRVRDVLASHRAIKQIAMTGAAEDALWTDRAAEIIAASASACAASLNKDVSELTGAELAAFVQSSPEHTQARDLLISLKEFMEKIDALGLSPGEASVPKETILSILAGRDLTPEQVAGTYQAITPVAAQPTP